MSKNFSSVDSVESSQSTRREQQFDITKEQLEYDLFIEGLSASQISKKYGTTSSIIRTRIRNYGIPIDPRLHVNSQQVRLLFLQNAQFTDKQRSVIVGSILGDGHISKYFHTDTRNAYLQCSQCGERKDYLLWKAEILKPFVRDFYRMSYKETYLLDTVVYPLFNEFYNLFWINGRGGRKIIPTDIVNLNGFNDLALAVWFMDDGHRDRSMDMLCVNCFTVPECEILMDALYKKFNAQTVLTFMYDKQYDRKYPHIEFRRGNRKILHDIVDPLMHPCFEYKKISVKYEHRTHRKPRTLND